MFSEFLFWILNVLTLGIYFFSWGFSFVSKYFILDFKNGSLSISYLLFKNSYYGMFSCFPSFIYGSVIAPFTRFYYTFTASIWYILFYVATIPWTLRANFYPNYVFVNLSKLFYWINEADWSNEFFLEVLITWMDDFLIF
jgi:hypothetical protein